MIYIAKVFSIIMGCLVIFKSYYDFKKGKENFQLFLFWVITWMIIIFITLFPESVNEIIARYGMSKTGTGTFFGMALVFLFFITYRVYAKANRLEQKIKDIVTKIGIQDINND